MELSFEYSLSMEDGEETFLGQENDGLLTEFYLREQRLLNKSSPVDDGQFDSIELVDTPQLITLQAVRDFGISSFPHIGTYGFFTPAHLNTSYAVFPIYQDKLRGAAPLVTSTVSAEAVALEIEGDYECYRVVFRQGLEATEFITYEGTFVTAPMYSGECILVVTGHNEEISYNSKPYEEIVMLSGAVRPLRRGAFVPVVLSVSDWSSNIQHVTISGMTEDLSVLVAPAPSSQIAYVSSGVFASAQSSTGITFYCAEVPSVDLQVGVQVL